MLNIAKTALRCSDIAINAEEGPGMDNIPYF